MNTFLRKIFKAFPTSSQVILAVLMLAVTTGYAQNIAVKSFRLAENDLTAQNPTTKRVDMTSGELCALIRVQTTEKGFGFEFGSLGWKRRVCLTPSGARG